MQQPQRVDDPPDGPEQQARGHQADPEGHVEDPRRQVVRGVGRAGERPRRPRSATAAGRPTAAARRSAGASASRCTPGGQGPARSGAPSRGRAPEQQQHREGDQDGRAGAEERQPDRDRQVGAGADPVGEDASLRPGGAAAPRSPCAAPPRRRRGRSAVNCRVVGVPGVEFLLDVVAVHVHLVGDVTGDDQRDRRPGGDLDPAGVAAGLAVGDGDLDPLHRRPPPLRRTSRTTPRRPSGCRQAACRRTPRAAGRQATGAPRGRAGQAGRAHERDSAEGGEAGQAPAGAGLARVPGRRGGARVGRWRPAIGLRSAGPARVPGHAPAHGGDQRRACRRGRRGWRSVQRTMPPSLRSRWRILISGMAFRVIADVALIAGSRDRRVGRQVDRHGGEGAPVVEPQQGLPVAVERDRLRSCGRRPGRSSSAGRPPGRRPART